MDIRIQTLFDLQATASRSSIMRSIIAYMNSMVPLCYKKPALLPDELSHALNSLVNKYRLVSSFPAEIDEHQLFIDLHLDRSEEMGIAYLRGNFRAYISGRKDPALEDVFYIIVSSGGQVEALNRQLHLYGELIDYKVFPRGRKPAPVSASVSPEASLTGG